MRVAADEKKQQLLGEVKAAREEIVWLAATWPPHRQDAVFLGNWSVKDLLAHLIGWDFANLQAMQDILADQLPQFYAHHDRDWRTFNALLIGDHKRGGVPDLIQGAGQSHRALLSFLANIPADEFDRDGGIRFKGWKVTIARLLQAEVSDERTHAAQLKAFPEAQC